MSFIRRAILVIILPMFLFASCATEAKTEITQSDGSGDGVIRNSEFGIRNEDEGDGGYEETGDRQQGTGDAGFKGIGNGNEWRIRVAAASGEEIWSFSEAELAGIQQENPGAFTHAYSTINNWPTARFYVADGYSVESILRTAGALDSMQTVTFRSADGYEVSLTRDQLLSDQYYFPQVGDSADGAEPVVPIIAYRWHEGTSDLGELREDKPTLIIGQRNHLEHTNPAFVVEIAEIIVDKAPCETWSVASTFPMPGLIAQGETVKLQHQSFGLVKLHYTLDGSDPSPLSPMYNPSTYQPELNEPIPINEPTTIKVLVTGYGKNDSEIATFDFEPVP